MDPGFLQAGGMELLVRVPWEWDGHVHTGCRSVGAAVCNGVQLDSSGSPRAAGSSVADVVALLIRHHLPLAARGYMPSSCVMGLYGGGRAQRPQTLPETPPPDVPAHGGGLSKVGKRHRCLFRLPSSGLVLGIDAALSQINIGLRSGGVFMRSHLNWRRVHE